MTDPDRLLLIGYGHALRGDDGVGAAVVRALRDAPITAVAFDGDGTELMTLWQDRSRVVVIDASQGGGTPGAVLRFDATAAPLPAGLMRHSSHQFGLAEAIEMARALDQLPSHLIVYAVEGKTFQLGDALSAPIEAALPQLSQQALQDLTV